VHDSKFRLEILEMLSECGVSGAQSLDRRDRASGSEFLEPISRSLRASKKWAGRAAVTVRRHSRRALLHTCQTIFFATVTVVSAVALVRGAIGGLTRLFGDVRWIGELVGASIFLGTTIAVVLASTNGDDHRSPRVTANETEVTSPEPALADRELL
jgi:hypothetical protein